MLHFPECHNAWIKIFWSIRFCIFEAFAAHGEVTYIEDSDSPITDETKSLFVTYAKPEDAVEILKDDTFTLKDATVSVCEAVPKKTQVFVGGLRPETDEDDLVAEIEFRFSIFGFWGCFLFKLWNCMWSCLKNRWSHRFKPMFRLRHLCRFTKSCQGAFKSAIPWNEWKTNRIKASSPNESAKPYETRANGNYFCMNMNFEKFI